MNNYYTLIYIVNELKSNLNNAVFDFAITPFKNVLETYFIVRQIPKRLVFSASPTNTALFLEDYQPPKKSNITNFFECMEGAKIVNISLMQQDRLVDIGFSNNRSFRFLLFGNNPNVFLINRDELVRDAFKNPANVKNRQAPQPQKPQIKENVSKRMKTKNIMLAFNPQLPRTLLPDVIRQHGLSHSSVEEIKAFVEKITWLLENEPAPRVLETGDVCLWPREILDIPTRKTFQSVNECVKYAYRETMYLRQLSNEKGDLVAFLDKQEKQHRALKEDLDRADKSLERSKVYQQTGHILMAHAHEESPSNAEIILEDIFHPGQKKTIAVDPAATFAQNAQTYYKKAEAAERNYREARRRLKHTRKVVEDIKMKKAELEEMRDLKQIRRWKKQNRDFLASLGWGDKGDIGQKPFRVYRLGGHQLWVGRNAKSNDKLTSQAHKEDIWLHARGVSGSHVVIRMNNSKKYPQKNIILRAAALAAFFSKARGSKYVPVMYTKRKYVRKPKGATAGAVVVEREEVEMVEPQSPQEILDT